MVELRGNKIVLRTLERGHCRELWQAYDPIDPLPTESLNPGLSVENADKWFEEMQAKQGTQQVYLGVFTDEGKLLGDVQLSNIDWKNRTAGVGLSIAREADRHQGFGFDASLIMVRYAFRHLDLHRVSAATASHNTPAQRILEKCGFVHEGTEREAIFCDGRRMDRLIYGLLRKDFDKREPLGK